MTDVFVVLCTAARAEAPGLAKGLVEDRYAACVNLVEPVRSIYRWEGKIEESDETMLVIKTTRARLDGLVDAIRERHSYDCPEVVAVGVEKGNEAYLAWVSDSVDEP